MASRKPKVRPKQPAPRPEATGRQARKERLLRAGSGLALGVLVWTGALALGIDAFPYCNNPFLTLAAGIAGALISLTRARGALWIAAGAVTAALLGVMYTPLVEPSLKGWLRREPVGKAEAVVVLASDINTDGTLTDKAQQRFMQGFRLLGQGYAPRLVLTRMAIREQTYQREIRDQMRALRLRFPIDEVGPVWNTRDEAVVVARLARERGWKRLILVTHPSHMRRAEAVFEKAGVPVLASPCTEGEYDLGNLSQPDHRLFAFRDWLHEVVGYQVYRLRGWI